MDKKKRVQALLNEALENNVLPGWQYKEVPSITSKWRIEVFYDKDGYLFSPLLAGKLNNIVTSCEVYAYMNWDYTEKRIVYAIFN